MDKRILDLVSTRLVLKKNEIEVELEKLINNGYNFSVEETIEKIEENVNKLNNAIFNIQMWENIISQTKPQNNQNPDEGNNNQ